jgi:hypothetical protein
MATGALSHLMKLLSACTILSFASISLRNLKMMKYSPGFVFGRSQLAVVTATQLNIHHGSEAAN